MKRMLTILSAIVLVSVIGYGCASKAAKTRLAEAQERAATQPADPAVQQELEDATAAYNDSVEENADVVNKTLTVGAAGAAAVPGYGTLISTVLLGLTTIVGFVKNHNKKGQLADKQVVIDELIEAAATLGNAVKNGLPEGKASPELDKALTIINALKKAADEWSASKAQA